MLIEVGSEYGSKATRYVQLLKLIYPMAMVRAMVKTQAAAGHVRASERACVAGPLLHACALERARAGREPTLAVAGESACAAHCGFHRLFPADWRKETATSSINDASTTRSTGHWLYLLASQYSKGLSSLT